MNERAIFEAALEIEDPLKRHAFIEKACAGDAELYRRVEALLKSHETAGSFLEPPPIPASHVPPRPADLTSDFNSSQGTAELSEKDEDRAAVLHYLQPSTKPGSLGVLGHYEVLQLLGQGGFGIVFKAFDEKLHRHVAIKVLSPHMAATSPPRKRFSREARAAAKIKHENIIQVYDVEEQPLPYLVMEYVEGQTLGQKLDGSGPLETSEVLHIARQIVSGLAAAHEKGLIHRDIKPGNILIEQGADQKIKITDFGLARAVDDATMTHSGMIAGTPMYMAPEQALGKDLDHRADLFSFGSVMYQMACGRPPFRAPTTLAVLRRVADESPRPMREILPEIPDWLAAIVHKLHEKNPDERYQSAKEVADLLAKCQAQLSSGHAADLSTSSTQTSRPPIPSASKAASDHRLFIPALVTVGVALVLLAGFFLIDWKPLWNKRGGDHIPSQPLDKTASLSNLPYSANAERELAQWVLSLPSFEVLTLYLESGAIGLKPGDQLPDAPFTVHAISTRAADNTTDDDLALIAKARELASLTLATKDGSFAKITDQGLDQLASPSLASSLRQFQIYGRFKKISDHGYLPLGRLKNLNQFTFDGLPRGQGAFLSQLGPLPKLALLNITGNKIPSGWMQSLTERMPDLEDFRIAGSEIVPADLQALKRLDLLKELALTNCGLNDQLLDSIDIAHKLEGFGVEQNSDLTDAAIARLITKASDKLISVGLNDTNMGDETCRALARLPKYSWLWANHTRVSDRGLAELANCKTIYRLYLNGNKRITDTGLESLAKITSLVNLSLQNNPQLSEPAILKLRAALPQCKITWDGGVIEPSQK